MDLATFTQKIFNRKLHFLCSDGSTDVNVNMKELRNRSYGGDLARLGGLARLGEISPSLRNSYKNIICPYEE